MIQKKSASMVVAPDGQIVAQTELCQSVLIADVDTALATRAMWKAGRRWMTACCLATR
jgi:predicted amidohydrolase